MFELFIARRYLRAKRKQVVISVITVISVMGVAAGVMALVIALAINNGFSNTLQRNLLGATAHVSILEKEPGDGHRGLGAACAEAGEASARGQRDAGALRERLYQRTGAGRRRRDQRRSGSRPGTRSSRCAEASEGRSADGLIAGDDDLPGIILGSRLAESIGAVNGKTVQIMVTTEF